MDIRRIIICISVACLLIACAGKSNKSASEEAVSPIILGAMPSMDYIPFVVAEHMGMYDSLGVEVEIVKFFSANDRDAAFRMGSVDGTVIDYTGAALQHANGVPLALVMKHDGFFEMLASPTYTSSADLKGKRVSVSGNTVIEYVTDRILTEAGLTEEDIEKVEINKIPLRMEMLVAGEINASVFPDPFASIATAKGFKSLASTRELGISIVGTIFTGKAIAEKSKSIRLLIEGYNLAVEYIQSQPREAWMHLLVEHAGVPQEMAATISLPSYTPAALPGEADIKSTIEWLKAKELIPQSYDGAGLVDPSFI